MQKEIECNKERLICLYLLYDGKQSKVYKTLNTTTNEIYATKMIERKNEVRQGVIAAVLYLF